MPLNNHNYLGKNNLQYSLLGLVDLYLSKSKSKALFRMSHAKTVRVLYL